ncbi:hypothetical protein FJMB80055_22360 [Enterobacter hormaechei]|nr:hypothetical protein OIPHN069_18780 [Enterobacter hormaechei subsp. hoffmannii]BDI78257.1 hypothetical protein FJMB80001_19280 [Enterobacter hormaechei]GJJ91990.1 hypothetical protein TUM16654_02700 [Enterobacter cloacae]BDI88075.1 hypothetical protein FJMB80003_18830 [Enterobacter hormaechei]BDJ17172.1 hypothetical protein FJMB80012_18730 [Enterobacter hormaechei]
MAEHRNGQRCQHAGDGSNQETAKHRADVGVCVKTLHEVVINGDDTILWRENVRLAKGMRAEKGRAVPGLNA